MSVPGIERPGESKSDTFEGMFHYDDLAEGFWVRLNRTVIFLNNI